MVRGLGKAEFTLAEVYAFAPRLARLHPQNPDIEPKIRQQLQRLRDLGFAEFLGGARYRTGESGVGSREWRGKLAATTSLRAEPS